MVFGVTGEAVAGIEDDEDIGGTEELENTGISELKTGAEAIVEAGGMEEEVEIGITDGTETCVEDELVVSAADIGGVGDAE